MTEPVEQLIGRERVYELTTSDDGSAVLAGEQFPDVRLLCRPGLDDATGDAPFPLWIQGTVAKPIYADGELAFLVVDVTSVHHERPGPDDGTASEPVPNAESDCRNHGLQQLAEELVDEAAVEPPERDRSDSVVVDGHGERDRADATRSPQRDREIRREMGRD